ncbi:Uncharacterised protein [Candidatus Gugararchaeum adminiculabundum]|nr:Uncharacterised protein [Candidatus Gugararchaeum adminiculabundum]
MAETRKVLEAMQPVFKEALGLIRQACDQHQTVILRYNNDADGISGGLAIEKTLYAFDCNKIYASQNNSAFYEAGSALRDLNFLRGSRGLVIIVDCGANAESVEGLKIAKAAGNKILVIDHHPTKVNMKDLAHCYCAPFEFGGSSEIPAGYLACQVARLSGKVDAKQISELEMVSCAGDKSHAVTPNDDAKRKALVLDYACTYMNAPNNLEFYEQVLEDSKLLLTIYSQVNGLLEEIGKIGSEKARKVKIGKVNVNFANISSWSKRGGFPSSGKACGVIHDHLKSQKPGEPIVTFGYGGKTISVRANTEAQQAGFSANKLITALKEEMPEAIESGGGHDVAASIKVRKDHGKIVLAEIEKQLEKMLK